MAKHFAFVALVLYSFCQGTVARYTHRPFCAPHILTPTRGRYAGHTPQDLPGLDRTVARSLSEQHITSFDGELSTPLIEKSKDIPNTYDAAKMWANAHTRDFPNVLNYPGMGMANVDTTWRGKRRRQLKGIQGAIPLSKARMRGVEIVGPDKNKIPLDIYQGKSETCFYYTHGSHVLSAHNELFVKHLTYLSEEHDMTMIAVDFRNHLFHPDREIKSAQFPAGLNDAYAGLKYVHEHKKELGCSSIVNMGEGAGGNMCLTLSLKMVKEGDNFLAGSFCHSPESDNDVFSKRVQSSTENADFGISYYHESHQKMFIDFFTKEEDRHNPLAFAIEAGAKDMKGMPPVMITINELSPFRDVGSEMYRNLLRGGVDVEARMSMGTLHSADFFGNTPLMETTVGSLKDFAKKVARGQSLTETKWLELGEGKECDTEVEVYLKSSSGNFEDLSGCQASCVRSISCKSITYFGRSGFCSHFSTECKYTVKRSRSVQSFRIES